MAYTSIVVSTIACKSELVVRKPLERETNLRQEPRVRRIIRQIYGYLSFALQRLSDENKSERSEDRREVRNTTSGSPDE